MNVTLNTATYRVDTLEYFYRVMDSVGARWYVYKDKRCSCGSKDRCVHVRAVSGYLKQGGQLALSPDTPRPTTIREQIEERVSQIRQKRVTAIATGEISDTLAYFLELVHLNETFHDRLDFFKKWKLEYEVIDV